MMFVVSSLPSHALVSGYSGTNIENHKHAKFCEKPFKKEQNNINHMPQLVEVILNLKLWDQYDFKVLSISMLANLRLMKKEESLFKI